MTYNTQCTVYNTHKPSFLYTTWPLMPALCLLVQVFNIRFGCPIPPCRPQGLEFFLKKCKSYTIPIADFNAARPLLINAPATRQQGCHEDREHINNILSAREAELSCELCVRQDSRRYLVDRCTVEIRRSSGVFNT